MGGVGSFIGAKLTKNYEEDKTTEIIFICRGETKENINKKGLSLTSEGRTFHSKPTLASDHPEEIGVLDILIIATKSFSLAAVVKQYQECFRMDTIIIPIQNGVNAKEIIRKNLNKIKPHILEGCIYIVSNIEKPGIVNHIGGPGKIFFGNEDNSDFHWVEDILRKGGIEAKYTKKIKEILWKKFLFLSPLAAMTTAYNITFGELVEKPAYMDQLKEMMYEVKNVAIQYNVLLTAEDIEDSLGMLSNFPYKAKSSLQLDFENKKDKTEKLYLVDHIIESGNKFGVNVDTYKKMDKKIAAFSA